MPYVSPDVVAQARQMDLLTYLRNYEPDELVKVGGIVYCTRTHDSLKISNGKWCWFSRGIGGKSALDYLIKVQGLSFTAAVEQIVGQTAIQPSIFMSAPSKAPPPKKLLLPPANRCATHVVNYLTGRGIDPRLIDFCIQRGLLYESSPHHNVVFLGLDKYGKARYANLRGIVSDFKGEATGSDKRFSFNIPVKDSQTLHLFESAIDLLSYATMEMLDGRDWQRDHLLSLAGVYAPKKEIRESSMPLALQQYLVDHPEITTIVLRLDNDYAGRLAAGTLQTILPEKYTVIPELAPQGKDYNDTLKIRRGLCQRKEVYVR